MKNGRTAIFAANTWHKLYDPFTPMRTGNLAHDSIDIYAEGDVGVIHHKAPYAAKMYYGDGFNFNTEKHPLATSHWDKAAEAAGKKEDLIKDVQAFIERG